MERKKRKGGKEEQTRKHMERSIQALHASKLGGGSGRDTAEYTVISKVWFFQYTFVRKKNDGNGLLY